MASDRQLDGNAIARDDPFDYCEINFPDASILELARERGARERGSRHHHHTGSILVEAMHDSRAQHAVGLSHRRELGKSREQTVDEGAVGMPRRGMHGHAGGLVNDDYFVVGEYYTNLRRVAFFVIEITHVGGWRRRDFDAIAGAHSARGARGGTV